MHLKRNLSYFVWKTFNTCSQWTPTACFTFHRSGRASVVPRIHERENFKKPFISFRQVKPAILNIPLAANLKPIRRWFLSLTAEEKTTPLPSDHHLHQKRTPDQEDALPHAWDRMWNEMGKWDDILKKLPTEWAQHRYQRCPWPIESLQGLGHPDSDTQIEQLGRQSIWFPRWSFYRLYGITPHPPALACYTELCKASSLLFL